MSAGRSNVESREAVLRIDGLSKWFGSTQVLREIALQVSRGEVVAIIGPSGSGKSTLLRCINFLEQFERGRIEVVGQRLFGLKDEYTRKNSRTQRDEIRQIRSRVGMVFQKFNLFPHLTVLDNLIVGPTTVHRQPYRAVAARARELLERVGLAEKYDAYPRTLSGGQQQRVAIARTLIMRPEVLLLDEITSALDPELIGEVLRVVQELAAEGQTMLIVTHEMDFAKDVADRVVMMNDGCIIEEAPPSKIFSDPSNDRTRRFVAKVIEKHRAA